MLHEMDIPPRLASLVRLAIGVGTAGLGVAVTALTLCLQHGKV